MKAQSKEFAYPGMRFRTRPAANPEEYLEIVKRSEAYIASNMVSSAEGYYWKNPDTGEIDLTFYSGCAGVIYFYLKLYEIFPEQRYLDIILKGTSYLLAHIKDFDETKPAYDLPKVTQRGLYFGLAGLGLLFLEVYKSTGDSNAEAGTRQIAAHYIAAMKQNKKGAYWSVSPALAMDGGIILYLLDYYNTFPEEHLKSLLLSAGEHYLSVGKRQKSGTLEYDGYGGLFPYSTPNFEFGNSGAGYVLTKLYDFSGDGRYLQAAIDTANYLLEVRVAQEKGYLIPYRLGILQKRKPNFYVGICHGPAGTSRLFYRLYELTGDRFWYQQITELVDGMEAIGIPEQQTAGLWNNISYCCGHGGFVHFFLSLYHTDQNNRWHELAICSANVILGEMEVSTDDSVKWQIAWKRVRPYERTAPVGFYDGAAGIATALLELYLTETKQFVWTRLIDDPFPGKTVG